MSVVKAATKRPRTTTMATTPTKRLTSRPLLPRRIPTELVHAILLHAADLSLALYHESPPPSLPLPLRNHLAHLTRHTPATLRRLHPVSSRLAAAILSGVPANTASWTPRVLAFLLAMGRAGVADPRVVSRLLAATGRTDLLQELVGLGTGAGAIARAALDPWVVYDAAANGHAEVVELILPLAAARAASPDAGHVSRRRRTADATFRPALAMQLAAAAGHVDVVRVLLTRAAGLAWRDARAGLDLAAEQGQLGVVRELWGWLRGAVDDETTTPDPSADDDTDAGDTDSEWGSDSDDDGIPTLNVHHAHAPPATGYAPPSPPEEPLAFLEAARGGDEPKTAAGRALRTALRLARARGREEVVVFLEGEMERAEGGGQ
ncbi:hypothetical protein HDU96_004036 [Phlyctochytrium bullatum]|nr:hypothetical protein HDU96_004036 [Phlyctochytrium bullatum]